MLADLREQRQQIDEAIAVIERLASGRTGKRRGRPPAWMKKAETESAAPEKKGRTFSEAQRREASLRIKKRWAAKKKAAASA